MAHYARIAAASALAFWLIAFPVLARAQADPNTKSPQSRSTEKTRKKAGEPSALETEQRTIALSLLTSLADEARSYHDQTLRARVQARAADAMWDSDAEKARALFRRAWEAADAADTEAWRRYQEERQRQSTARTQTYLQQPANLRAEVLRLSAKRDRALAEEFLSKLTDDEDRNLATASLNASNTLLPRTADPESPSPDVVQRLQLARQLLEEGDTARALLFADKVLDRVTTQGINFLSALREKDQVAADQRFANMLARTMADPSSDAVGISVLSSYVLTPFLYIIVRGDGNNHSSQERERIVAPAIPPALRLAFLSGAAQIFLRPLQPPEQDRTVAGRRGLYFTIARLLPLFEQYAPDLAPALRIQLTVLAPDVPEDLRTGRNSLLTRGLLPEDQIRDEGSEALDRAERIADSAERDLLFVRAALAGARKGDANSRDIVEKIGDSDLRKRTRAHVDFTLISRAIDRKDPQEAQRLLNTADLTNIQRAWALLEVARLLKKTDNVRAGEMLDEATTVARRIGGSDADRARALVGVATQMFEINRGRVWESLTEAIKAANSVSEFSGEDAEVVARLSLGRGGSTTNFTVENFDLPGIFGALAKDDLYRSIDLARSFTSDAPRASATLAIARAVLEAKKEGQRRGESQIIRN